MADLMDLGAGRLVDAYRTGETSPVEVVDALLSRIEALDPALGAFADVTAARARSEAAAATAALGRDESLGPLHGVPVAVKEIVDVEGARVSYGSEVFAGRVATADAESVRRLRAAGAIVLGTTRTHEFAWGITTRHPRLGGTRNPWDPERVAGGSSGGSAAAVAARLAPVALGTDTGGSIRIPAAFCGILGLKPTHGRTSLAGVLPLAPTLDHLGPLARDPDDLVRVLSVLAGRSGEDPATVDLPSPPALPVERIRVAVCPDLHPLRLAPDHAAAFDAACRLLDEAAGGVERVDAPWAESIVPTFVAIQRAEALHVHRRLLGTFPAEAARYGDDVRGRLEAAGSVTLDDYISARAERLRIRRRFEEMLGTDRVLLSAVSAGPPSSVADPDTTVHDGQEIPFRDLVLGFTVPQDVTGFPAVAVPAGRDARGLPVGVQVTALPGREEDAVAVARLVAEALPLGPPPDPAAAG